MTIFELVDIIYTYCIIATFSNNYDNVSYFYANILSIGIPENISAIFDHSMEEINVSWNNPKPGLTNHDIRSFRIECLAQDGNTTYTIKSAVDHDSPSAVQLQINGDFISPTWYNCCVEAVFDEYSSKACASVVNANTSTADGPTTATLTISTVTTTTLCTPLERESSNNPMIGIRLMNARNSYALFGCLSSLIVILLSTLMMTSLFLRKLCQSYRSTCSHTR